MVDDASLRTLRAALAADPEGRPRYVIGAAVRVHPATLSQYARGHRPIPRELFERILREVHWNETAGVPHG